MNKQEIDTLCDVVRQSAFELHKYLRHGHLEKIYENGLAHRLGKQGIKVLQQTPVPVKDEDGTLLGDLIADLLIENGLIVELKAARNVTDDHVAQLIGYLRGSGFRYGLLINFGNPKLFIKRYVLD
ncbi:GxxExxY protein [Rubellicoccus peritrichatus]|uniref:GxxExxY protein n=1 Tax=Rubellicoccus peritrichatus TaxID=3080537 RepID=A0AAQ3LE46_9BACT|nr:GxxExxY protein [Puniceicoccus sp. CR14]WOO42967.1 GxxExxY protein [Puniceicoccus sp. CR14]